MQFDVQKVVQAAEAAGQVVLEYFGKVTQVTEKTSAKSVVTEADHASEQLILSKLADALPGLNVYAEESGAVDNGSQYTIIIDPLDGTSNFVMGIPTFTISIGIVDQTGRSVLGVVHHPILKRTYWAEAGKGAWLNGAPIHVNDVADSAKATASFGCGYESPPEYRLALIERTTKLPLKRLMENWSPAYEFCLLASGKMEAIISNGLDLEDYAAGKLILREAGGEITDFKGSELADDRANVFVASNGTALHQAILKIV